MSPTGPIRLADLTSGAGSVIGVPIPDLKVYLLDEKLQPVPLGLPGEICVAGAGVARGYLNRPELTANVSLPIPSPARPASRLYRSGDLARYTAQGELEYLGRMDHQVKIRGFRVELGEIESALNQHPTIRESVVLALDGPGGAKRLVAYIVPAGDAPWMPGRASTWKKSSGLYGALGFCAAGNAAADAQWQGGPARAARTGCRPGCHSSTLCASAECHGNRAGRNLVPTPRPEVGGHS